MSETCSQLMNEVGIRSVRVLILIFWFVINGLAFLIYGLDKRRARQHKRRISERRLLLLAMLGGGFGAYLAAQYYRHKTKAMRFRILLPIGLIISIALVAAIWIV